MPAFLPLGNAGGLERLLSETKQYKNQKSKKIKFEKRKLFMTTFSVKPNNIFIRHNVSDGKGPYSPPAGTIQHRLQFSTTTLDEVPAELFAVKISQSPKPEKKGKLVFNYFSIFINNQWETLVPQQLAGKSNEEIKEAMIALVKQQGDEVRWNFNMNLPSPFLAVDTEKYGSLRVYDNTAYPYTMGQPTKEDQTPDLKDKTDWTILYYLKYDADVTLHFKLAVSKKGGTEYYQITMSSDAEQRDIFKAAKTSHNADLSSLDGADESDNYADNYTDSPWG